MEEISKKDLLLLTGISYGQLYRWKRKGLIPEEWFIKKASFTGQETYFPKELILERIDQILEYKDDISLEELADIINQKYNIKNIDIKKLIENHLLIHDVTFFIDKTEVSFDEIVFLKMIDNIYHKMKNHDEIKSFLTYLYEHSNEIMNEYKTLYCITKDDKLTSILVKENDPLEFQLNDIIKINITNLIDNIKLIVMI